MFVRKRKKEKKRNLPRRLVYSAGHFRLKSLLLAHTAVDEDCSPHPPNLNQNVWPVLTGM